MSYIYNITFILEADRETKFLDWVRHTLLDELFNPGSPARNPSLKKVVEVPGKNEQDILEQAPSIALQAEFSSVDEAHEWSNIYLKPALGRFMSEFGPDSLTFVTMLENIPI